MTFGLGKTIEKVDRLVVAREEEEVKHKEFWVMTDLIAKQG